MAHIAVSYTHLDVYKRQVVAPQDGTIASIDVAEGASVENGDTLATMN